MTKKIPVRGMSTDEIRARLKRLEGRHQPMGLRGWAYRDALDRRSGKR